MDRLSFRRKAGSDRPARARSDSWNRGAAVVSPGCISREQFETDTRCPHGEDRCCHGYPAGVIPVPGASHRPGLEGWLFFATREAAEDHRYEAQALSLKELRRAMADAHPDRGGTAEQFIQARRRYQAALRLRHEAPPSL